jgi:hypothetical protein
MAVVPLLCRDAEAVLLTSGAFGKQHCMRTFCTDDEAGACAPAFVLWILDRKGQSMLEQLAAQYASQPQDPRTKQHNAAGLGSGSRAGGAEDRERLRSNRADSALRGLRGATASAAAYATVLIPVDRVATGDGGILQVEPVGCTAGASPTAKWGDVDTADGDRVNVETILINRLELIGQCAAIGRPGTALGNALAIDRSTVLPAGNRPLYRCHGIARVLPDVESKPVDCAGGNVERVTHDVTEIDCPGIDGAEERTVVIEGLAEQ